MSSQDLQKEFEILNNKFPTSEVVLNQVEAGEASINVNSKEIVGICRELKENSELLYHVLQAVSGVDYPDYIEINYILGNFIDGKQLILKTNLEKDEEGNNPNIDSVTSIWSAANFQEREVIDLLGVNFNNHPNLRRILCPDDWEGYPLRKDYTAQEYYRGMKVYPEEKNNSADRAYAGIVKEEEKKKMLAEKKRLADLKAKEEAENKDSEEVSTEDKEEGK